MTQTDAIAPLGAPPDDQPARERILTELDTNFLVEAGAGSGKTTSLVGRMHAHVVRGTPVEQLAAVTFTRKAANEMRERFQVKLEAELLRARTSGTDLALIQRLDRALQELDRAFIGTIHSFCARLLREHPLEARLDPGFQEVAEDDWDELCAEFWRRWMERCRRVDDDDAKMLRALGVDVRRLEGGFRAVMLYPDVRFPLPEADAPDTRRCRARLEELLDDARALMPAEQPDNGWDALQSTVRRLSFQQRTRDWEAPAVFCELLESIGAGSCKPTLNRWASDGRGKAAVKELGERFASLLETEIVPLLQRWHEHRYPLVVRFLQRAAAEFTRQRLSTGQLGFEDLLLRAAELLRDRDDARAALARRYPYLLVDEFQDTDPIQAEVCLLLASDPTEGNDWRRVRPRSGSLFVVGDPKQSIYRFRRADIVTYGEVKQILQRHGDVLRLTKNFRSVRPIEDFVNEHFERALPPQDSAQQAAFAPMVTHKPATSTDGVSRYVITVESRSSQSALVEEDADAVASLIHARLESGSAVANDFLLLTPYAWMLPCYARALASRGVPARTTGARLPQEHELRELIVVLQALADPENPVLVAAALQGLFFGCSPADLWDAKRAGARFAITHPPVEADGAAGRALATLYRWWILAQRQPVDTVLGTLLDETGLLAHAASQELGEARAGALLHLVESVRVASQSGAGDLARAIEHIDRRLAEQSEDAPLRPGREDAVRVMNLHKAKGLEARIVILAAPVDEKEHEVRVHIDRTTGDAVGWLVITDPDGRVIAQPTSWGDREGAERAFQIAERTRLLYVATTRAEHELVIGQCEHLLQGGSRPDRSLWSPLRATLDRHDVPLKPLARTTAGGRARLDVSAGEMTARVRAARERRAAADTPSFVVTTVTESAKQSLEEERAYDLQRRSNSGDGAAWGRAVHRTLEAMGRGRTGAALAAFIRAVVTDEALGATAEERASIAARLEVAAETVARSDAWRALRNGGEVRFELPIVTCQQEEERVRLVEGVIDAAAHDGDRWRIIDWKTDQVDDRTWAEREQAYRAQIEMYATMLQALSGSPVTEQLVRVPRA